MEEAKQNTMSTETVEQPTSQPRRTDYRVDLAEVHNGERHPVEVCEFADIMRGWRDRSAQSTQLVR